jgi:hypothetical protein
MFLKRNGSSVIPWTTRGRLPIERELRLRLEALGPDAQAELLRILGLTSEERAEEIGTLYADVRLQTTAELLMDLEDDPAARAIVTTELRIMNRQDG